MGYKLVISEYADELLNTLIYYLIYRLKNEQAAKHLPDGSDSIYDRLEINPFKCCWCFSSIGKLPKQAVMKQRQYYRKT